MIKAPWTQEQVENLNKYQMAGVFHPFTCPREHDRLYAGVELHATTEGWVCPMDCDYTQDWTHAWMAEPLPTFECPVCGTGYYLSVQAQACC